MLDVKPFRNGVDDTGEWLEKFYKSLAGNFYLEALLNGKLVPKSEKTTLVGPVDIGDSSNMFIGTDAGRVTSGVGNTFIGYEAGFTNTTGYNNIFIGHQAGYSNLSAYRCFFAGYQAGYSNTAGYDNIAIGDSAMYTNTTADESVAIGNSALYTSNGSFNTAVGFNSLKSTTTGTHNTAYGYKSGFSNQGGEYNVFVGGSSGYSNSSGNSNVAVGDGSLFTNTGGLYNTAVGTEAIFTSTGTFNTALGYHALYSTTVSWYGTAVGANALKSNTSGDYNTAVGNDALFNLVGTYSNNTAVGDRAGKFHADGTTALTTPANSVYIGAQSRGKDNSDSNSIVIGYQAIGQGANTAIIGNSSITDTYLRGIKASLESRFGDGGTTDYSAFEADGTLEFNGAATVWEDLRVEPDVRGTVGVRTPTFTQWFTDGAGSLGVYLYAFDDAIAAQEKECFFTMQMPHAWAGTVIYPHVHWVGDTADTAANPRWALEYTWTEVGADYGNTTIIYGTAEKIGASGATDADVTANRHYKNSLPSITPSASQDGISSVLIGRIFRNSSDAGDTYNAGTNACGLLYIDFHYEINTVGSRSEFVK